MTTNLPAIIRAGVEALTLRDLARGAEIDLALLQRGQGGDLTGWDVAMVVRLARVVGVDPALALGGEALPVPKLLAFLREVSADIRPQDTLALRQALSRASALRSAGLHPTLTYDSRRAPGKDAYNAGYAAARRVRRDLGIESEPMVDLRGVIETKLGVLVAVLGLQTPGLEALAIADEGGAAIVLNARLRLRPDLWRRSIAHELCHILFDPRTNDAIVDILAEGESDQPVPEGQRKNREQRARAFAAELLVPAKGLKDLFTSPCGGIDQARLRVIQACERFGAPWELVVHHLANHGGIDDAYRDGLLAERRSDASALDIGRPAAWLWARKQVEDGELSGGRARDIFGAFWADGDRLSV